VLQVNLEALTLKLKGTVRLDKKTKNLARRIRRGDIAVIDHQDIDSTSAEMLVERQVAAVVNVAASISGRYPNAGPQILNKAGIPLMDAVDSDLFKYLKEGEQIEINGASVKRDGAVLTKGELLTSDLIQQKMEDAKLNLGRELESFAENTLSYVIKEKSLLLDPTKFPHIDTVIDGRHALMVVRGDGYKEDLAIVRSYIRDVKPVLIGVDGGADALLEMGFRPDMIVGDMDSVSDKALKCGAEIIVHTYTDATRSSPGLDKVKELGVVAKAIAVPGTSEDLAMLLAYEKGAQLIVAVGAHSHLIDFLDKGRNGMSSTFLVRMRVGSKLVDAKGVSRLYGRRSMSMRHLGLIFLAASLVFLAIVVLSPTAMERLRSAFADLWVSVRVLALKFKMGLDTSAGRK
jgi:uncharacterized membrane-anchored protein